MLKKSYKKRFKSNIDVKDNNSRNIVLSSDISASSVADIIESILDINTLDDELEEDLQDYDREPIKLVVNSFGGSVYDGFALIAAIEHSRTPIHGYCYGSAMSMGFIIYISTHVRFAHKTATLMYHEISDMFWGNITNAKQNLKECDRLQKVYDDYVLSRTKLPVDKMNEYKARKEDWYMSAQEAAKYKIIHKII
jgi:ATP-dependent Clp protease, protease subunit